MAEADLEPWRVFIPAVAAGDGRIGPLAESVKWGAPSFTPVRRQVGSSVRLETRAGGQVAFLFICHTGLVDRFREIYPGLTYEGNRAIVFDPAAAPEDALRHCATLALTYFLTP